MLLNNGDVEFLPKRYTVEITCLVVMEIRSHNILPTVTTLRKTISDDVVSKQMNAQVLENRETT